MFELRDPTTGRQLFETISISLVRATILCQNVGSTLCPRIVVLRCATTA
jgi:hypothetical protein